MSGMNLTLNDMNLFNSMSSSEFLNETTLQSNCMLNDQEMQMLLCNPLPLQFSSDMNVYQNEPVVNVQQATPTPSPMNFKSVPPMLKVPMYNFTDPTCINSAPLFPMDFNYLRSPLNSPYEDNGYYMFNSDLTSPTHNLNSGRRASTPATYLSAKLLGEEAKPMKRRNSSQGIAKAKSSTSTPKTYACLEAGCNKVFKRSEHLKRHIKSIHTNERPFHCQYPGCVKSFSRQDNLGQHLRIHRDPMEKLKDRGVTSSTPFVLPICSPMENHVFHMN